MSFYLFYGTYLSIADIQRSKKVDVHLDAVTERHLLRNYWHRAFNQQVRRNRYRWCFYRFVLNLLVGATGQRQNQE